MQGILYCFDKKYLSYKAKFAVPKTIISKFGNKIFDISFDNIYRQNFYAEMDSDVKIHTNNDKFDYLSGKINIDNLTLKLGNKVLPPSYFHIILNKGRASLVSKFYTNINETADISADLKLKKPYEIKINCRCPKADINNLQQLAVPVLELLKIRFILEGSLAKQPHEIKQIAHKLIITDCWLNDHLLTFDVADEQNDDAIPRIKTLCKELGAEKIVLGLPKHMNGDIGIRANIALEFTIVTLDK